MAKIGEFDFDPQARPLRIGQHFYQLVNGRLWPHVAGADGDEGSALTAELIAQVEQAEDAEVLGALSLDEARELRTALEQGFDEARPNVNDAEGVAALTRVAAAVATVDARIGELSTTEEEVQAQLDELAAQVHGEGDGGEGDGADGGEGEGADGGEGEGEGEGEGGDAGEGAGGEGDAGEGRLAAAGVIRRPSLQVLRRTPQRGEPTPDAPRNPYRMTAAAGLSSEQVSTGQELSLEVLGSELATLHQSMQTLRWSDLPRYNALTRDGGMSSGDARQRMKDEGSTAGGRKVILGHIDIADRPGVVHQEKGDGAEIIDQAVREYVTARDERDRMVASGGDCVMALPDFSINVIGDRGTCFTDDLPTVASNRPLTYYPWLKIDQSASSGIGSRALADDGIGFVTEEEDAAGYGNPDAEEGDPDEIPEGGTQYKHTVHIDCPPSPLTCKQEAVYKGVVVGNFQAIGHPEYVDAFNTYMDIYFDIERDERALKSFVAKATTDGHLLTTAAAEKTFGAVSSLKDLLNRLVAKERSARHAPNLGFNVVAPDWFGGVLALDVMRHTFGSLDNLRATPAEAMALAGTDGIRFSTYCTETNFASTPKQVLTPITNGNVPAWPTSARLLIHADGSVFKKTAGSLQFGLRETLMETNDFGMFMEIFEKVCYRDTVYVLDVVLCPNGATGAPVALTC